MQEEGLAQGFGWFSIGLGLAAFAAPRALVRLAGIREHDTSRAAVRMVGVREMIAGVGLLSERSPAGWLWSRVVGDAMDLTLMGAGLISAPRRGRAAVVTAALIGVTAADVWASAQLSRRAGAWGDTTAERGVDETETVTVLRPPDDVYHLWRDLQQLPRFMDHLKSVEVTGDRRAHLASSGPAGMRAEWDIEIVEDRPNELIAWRSLPGAPVSNSGSVRLRPAPGGRGTEVYVHLRYDPPGGPLVATIARIFGAEPGQQMSADLRRMKQLLETGEITRSDDTVRGRGPNPGQPPVERPQRGPSDRERASAVGESRTA